MADVLRFLERAERVASSASSLRSFLRDAITGMEASKRRFVWLGGFEKLVVVGDLHGDLESLRRAVSIALGEGYPDKTALVFAGDYVDRGPQQVLTLLSVILLAQELPGSTIALRGNHEPPEHLVPYPHDLPLELAARYGEAWRYVYALMMRVFDALPLGAVDQEKGVLVVHGGLPVKGYGEGRPSLLDYLGGESDAWRDEYTEILWNDPSDHIDVSAPSPRGAGYLWGPRVTGLVERSYGVRLVVRGHEPAYEGYRYNHERRVLTVFSRLGPPYFNEKACVAIVKSCENVRLSCWP